MKIIILICLCMVLPLAYYGVSAQGNTHTISGKVTDPQGNIFNCKGRRNV